MKIIKQGKSKEELNKPKIKRFECYKCECVFEADETEYTSDTDYIYTQHIHVVVQTVEKVHSNNYHQGGNNNNVLYSRISRQMFL